MAEYLIELPHTKDECMKAFEEIKDSEFLPKINWGCAAGVHNGWAIIDTEDDAAARSHVGSEFMRSKANVIKVAKVTKEDIASYHKE